MNRLASLHRCILVGALGACVAACGGEIVGLGNTGNRIVVGDALEEVAELLAENPETPQVTDQMLGEVFSAILGRATEGDPAAARGRRMI